MCLEFKEKILLRFLTVLLVLCRGDVAGQFTVPLPTCPDDTFTFSCIVTGDINGITTWGVGENDECGLLHSTSHDRPCGSGSPFTATSGTGFGTTGATSFTSTLSGTATSALNGTLVECSGPSLERDLIGKGVLQILGPLSAPTLSCVDSSGDVSGSVNVTVSWTLIDGDSADFFLISITTNATQSPYGGLLNITTSSVTLTSFMAGYEYNITVRGVNCGSQEGRESEPLTIGPQVPAVPGVCTITVLFNELSEMLLFIDSTWDSVPTPVDLCPGLTVDTTQYQISFQPGSFENVRCTAERCTHTFEPPSNPPSSYDSVSVAAENVVGVGPARNCTTQTISTTNNLLTGEVVGVSSPGDAKLNCRFLSGFTGSNHCTVQYGTDPTYVNLPYSAESTETGTAGDSVSVVLRERLNSSTVYYYTVSAVSRDITVTVQGTFTTPEYSCSVMELWNLPAAADANFLRDVTLLNDTAPQYPSCDGKSVGSAVLVNTTLNTATVAYYNGTTAGSRACFVCSDGSGYQLNSTVATRLCQRDALWSGSAIICVCMLPQWNIAFIVIGSHSMVVTLVVVIVMIIVICKEENAKVRTSYIFLTVVAAIFLVFGVVLLICGLVVVSNPPNENTCDSTWQNRRNGLIASAYVASVLARIFAATMVWIHVHVYHNTNKMKKCCRIFLLVGATFIGVGLLVTLGWLLCQNVKERKKRKGLIALLVIAFFLTVIGVGLWIALGVIVYIAVFYRNEKGTT